MSGIRKPKMAERFKETFDGAKDYHIFSGGIPSNAYTEIETTSSLKSPRRIRYANKTQADKYYDRLVTGLSPSYKEGGTFLIFVDEFYRELQKRGLETITFIIDNDEIKPTMRSVVHEHSCFQISIDESILTAQVYTEEYDSFCQHSSDAACTFLLNSIDYNIRQHLCQLQEDADSFAVLWLRFIRIVQPTSVNHFENIKQKLINLKPTSYSNQNIESLINDARNYVKILASANQYSPTITVDLLTSIHNNCSQSGTF